MVRRIIAIAFVYLIAVAGWVFLAGTITYRTNNQDESLKRDVQQLWGTPLEQRAPDAKLRVERGPFVQAIGTKTTTTPPNPNGVTDEFDMPISQSNLRSRFELQPRQKGLLWYSLYKVAFTGRYTFENPQDKRGEMVISFAFPAANSQYDEFKFEVDGTPVAFTRAGNNMIV